jgi:hypothetical protein
MLGSAAVEVNARSRPLYRFWEYFVGVAGSDRPMARLPVLCCRSGGCSNSRAACRPQNARQCRVPLESFSGRSNSPTRRRRPGPPCGRSCTAPYPQGPALARSSTWPPGTWLDRTWRFLGTNPPLSPPRFGFSIASGLAVGGAIGCLGSSRQCFERQGCGDSQDEFSRGRYYK